MLKKVTGTIITRFASMLMAFLIVLLNTRSLGADGQGTVALVNFGIMCVLAVSNYIGGGAIVYLTPRIQANKLAFPAYIWALFSALVFYPIFKLIPSVPEDLLLTICALSFLQSVFTFHLSLLMGKEKIKAYNALQFLQVFGLLACLAVFYLFIGLQTVEAFIYSLFIASGITFIVSSVLVVPIIKSIEISNFKAVFKEIFDYGKFAQTGNVLQLLNYRLNFFFIENLLLNGRSLVGIYSVGTHASEAVWNIGKSLSVVLYSRVSNVRDSKYIRQLTLTFFKISFVSSLLIICVLLILPEEFYLFIFTDKFAGIKEVISFLSIGILSNSVSTIFAHYFSGIGKHFKNTWGSGIGLVVTLFAGLIFVYYFGLRGAAIASSLALFVQMLYLLISFMKAENVSLNEFLINQKDIENLRLIFSKKKE